jgi:hypothetical protein
VDDRFNAIEWDEGEARARVIARRALRAKRYPTAESKRFQPLVVGRGSADYLRWLTAAVRRRIPEVPPFAWRVNVREEGLPDDLADVESTAGRSG